MHCPYLNKLEGAYNKQKEWHMFALGLSAMAVQVYRKGRAAQNVEAGRRHGFYGVSNRGSEKSGVFTGCGL